MTFRASNNALARVGAPQSNCQAEEKGDAKLVIALFNDK